MALVNIIEKAVNRWDDRYRTRLSWLEESGKGTVSGTVSDETVCPVLKEVASMATEEVRSTSSSEAERQQLQESSDSLASHRTRHSVNLIWWFVLAALVGGMLYGSTFFLNKREDLKVGQEAETNQVEHEAFLTLAFRDLLTTPQSALTLDNLRDQLLALHRGGFSTVRSKRIGDFLVKHSALPWQPVLLTFDEPTEQAVEVADQALASFGMTALMFLDARWIENGNVSLPSWHRLKQLLASGRWEIGLIACPATALDTKPLLEVEPASYLRDRELLQQRLGGYTVQTVACPKTHQALDQSTLRHLAKSQIGSPLSLAFVSEPQGANYWDADALALKRIQVSGQWDSATLLSKLQAYPPRREAFVDDFSSQRFLPAWLPNGPNLVIKNRVLQFSVPEDKRGSVIVLGGSERWQDAYVEVQLAGIPQGQFWIYLRYKEGAPRLRLGVADKKVWLEEASTAAGKYHKLASETLSTADAMLSLRVAGQRAIARVNGKILSPRPVRLPPGEGSGGLALEVWDPVGKALTRIRRLKAAPAPEKDLIIPGNVDPALWTQLRQQVEEVSALTPVYFSWPSIGPKAPFLSAATLGIFSEYNALRLVPGVIVADQTPLTEASKLCAQAMRWADDPAYDGLNVIVDPPKAAGRWAEVWEDLKSKMALRGKTLAVTVLSPGQKQLVTSDMQQFLLVSRPRAAPESRSLNPFVADPGKAAPQESPAA